jgi:hypothetical protein
LIENKGRWDFARNLVELGGSLVRLQSKPGRNRVRRIYVQETVVVAAGRQVDIPVKVTLPDLRKEYCDWAIEPRQLGSTLLTARTVLKQRGCASSIRIMNLGSTDVILAQETYIGPAERVFVIENDETEVSGVKRKLNSVLDDRLKCVVEGLPKELTKDERQQDATFEPFERSN